MKDFLIQAIGFIPSVIAITSLQSPNRKRILVLQFICGFMWLTHYLLLGANTLAMTNVIGILRAVICYYNDKEWAQSKIFPIGIISLYYISLIFTWQGIASLLPTLAMTLTTIALWNHDMKLTRLLFLLNSPLMLIGNLLSGSYSCALIECVALASFILAVYRYDIAPNRKQKQENQKFEMNSL